ncbi:MAG: helix-turn-helix domain-containing protein [Rubrivivax sp.]
MRQSASPYRYDVRMVLRAPAREARTAAARPDDLITPIERGLGVLAAFRQGDEWLGNQEIAQRTNIPKATITRLTQTLAAEGFLNHCAQRRKYRLAPAVLTLGFASAHHTDFAASARLLVQKFSDDCGVFAALANRAGLDTAIVGSCHSAATLMTLALSDGAQFPIAGSPFGLALLAGLPEGEREYLLDRIRLRCPTEHRIAIRQRVADALEQVGQKGYYAAAGDWGDEMVVAAAPLVVPDRPAFVVGCAAPSSVLPRAKLVELVGPRLVSLAETLCSLMRGNAQGLGHA